MDPAPLPEYSVEAVGREAVKSSIAVDADLRSESSEGGLILAAFQVTEFGETRAIPDAVWRATRYRIGGVYLARPHHLNG